MAVLEEKVIASWKYRRGALDSKTAFLRYLFAIRANAAKAHADILTVWTDGGS